MTSKTDFSYLQRDVQFQGLETLETKTFLSADPLASTQTYQAEDATFHGAIIFSDDRGQDGDYVDFQNATGDYIEWNVNVTDTGVYDLTFNYAMGSKSVRPLEFSVNSTVLDSAMVLPRTTNWHTWEQHTRRVELIAGNNTVKIAATTKSGPNFDSLEVTGPCSLTLTANTVHENALAGSSIGTAAPDAPEAGRTYTYSLTDDATGRFTIDAGTGLLSVAANDTLDYETSTNHSISVRATDDLGLAYDKSFIINVLDINEAPSALSLNDNTINENASGGTVIGTVSVTDVDASDTHTFTLSDDAEGRFSINASTGELTVAVSADLDFEDIPSHDITVLVTDSGGLTKDQQFTIEVINKNEAPTDLNLTTSSVLENTPDNAKIGTVSTVDPDNGDTFSYDLTDNAGGRFSIDPLTGVLRVANTNLLDASIASAHDVTVEVTDGGGLTLAKTFTIAILPVTYQAEDADFVGPIVLANHSGFNGTGFVDFQNKNNDFIEWTIEAPVASQYELQFRYAYGSKQGERPLIFTVNGHSAGPDLEMPYTGGWTTWGFHTELVQLNEGTNTIRLTANGKSGPNFDELTIAPIRRIPAKVAFQTSDAAQVSGYRPDNGLAYSQIRGFGWINTADGTPIDMTDYTFNRATEGVDPRLDSVIQMQPEGTGINAAWEYDLPNGKYVVTVSVGDTEDGIHIINAEGVNLLPSFTPDSIHRYELSTGVVTVNDGKLTIDAIGGTNTTINYIEIDEYGTSDRPRITDSDPVPRGQGIKVTAAVNLDVLLLAPGQGVDDTTFNSQTVQLYKTEDGELIDGVVNATGGADAIIFQPKKPLSPNTHYTFRINGVRDEAGNLFEPFATTFTTDSSTVDPAGYFTKKTVASGSPYTSVVMSPDSSMLYAVRLDGVINRWEIERPSGNLINLQTFDGLVGDNPFLPRALIGAVFDPTDPNVLWVTSNASLFSLPADDFTGAIHKVTIGAGNGSSFDATIEDYVVNLPRSTKDHLANSLAFGPDGALYMTQGSNSAMGAPDNAWGLRPERLLTGAVLRIDPTLTPPAGGFNVQTEDYTDSEGVTTTGRYDPYAANAPVTIYATGVRNAYDLVWHSNGELYIPTNGSAAGGNTPDDPSTIETNEEVLNVSTQNDFLYRIEEGGYYGHPNPLRSEYIMNGGNPTADVDLGEVVADGSRNGYAVGTQPDPNYRGFTYDFGRNRSPNGVIEYLGNDDSAEELKNRLFVVEWSGGDDILALTPGVDGEITDSQVVASGFDNPLDLIEDPITGNIYVLEYANRNLIDDDFITLLRPVTDANIEVESLDGIPYEDRLVFHRIQNPKSDNAVHDEATVRVRNTGTDPLIIDEISINGPWEMATTDPTGTEIAPDDFIDITIRFIATGGDVNEGELRIKTNDVDTPTQIIELAGFWQQRSEGGQEPNLGEIVEVFGWDTAIEKDGGRLNNGGKIETIGDEIIGFYFRQADSSTPVVVQQLAAFHSHPGTATIQRFDFGSSSRTNIFKHEADDAQTILPRLNNKNQPAIGTFNHSGVFGFRVSGSRTDSTLNNGNNHYIRIFPALDRDGNQIPGTYIMGMDYAGINFDYNDNVYLLQNVTPAQYDEATVDEDSSVAIDVLANDSNNDFDATIDSFTQAENGTVTQDGDLLVYTPDANFTGTDTFTYVANWGTFSDTVFVTVNVNPVNDAPIANDDAATTDEDTAVTVAPLSNDMDIDGDTLAIDSVTQAANGTVTINGSDLIYTPDANFNGIDSFTYTISDGTLTSTATVNVSVNPVNDAPIAFDDAVTTDEDTAVTVAPLSNDTDIDGDTLAIDSVTQAANGTVTINGSDLIYTPDANFNGVDSFTYTISDGLLTSTATVNVTVNPVNDAPIAFDDAVTTDEDTAVTVAPLSNDTDIDGDTLAIDSVAQPANGTVTINGSDLIYTPDANFNGVDSFTYTISDGLLTSTATVNVSVNPVNDAPIAFDDAVTTDEDTAVTVAPLSNDTDIDGDTLAIDSVAQPANGTVTINGSDLIYTPDANFNGIDSFTYTISDGLLTSTATVNVSVNPVNDAPIAFDDAVTTDEDTAVTVAPLSNDTDIDGDTLAIDSVAQPANGTVTINGSDLIYTPDANFNGIDSFTYTISDGLLTSTATVNVTVNPVNDAPIAFDDDIATSLNTAVNAPVLSNDQDDDGDPLAIDSFGQGANGTVALIGNQLVYTPDNGFIGTDSFTYVITDGSLTSTATVNVTVS